jgi:anti-sigma factor RsiW
MTEQDDFACKDLVELITPYLDGELNPEQRARIDAHLAICDGCENALEQVRETIRVSGTLTDDQIPEAEREELRSIFRDWRSASPPA